MSLVEGQDYVFFPKAHVLENRLAKMSEACFLGTKDYIFVVPRRSIQSFLVATRITTYSEGEDPASALQTMLAQGDLTVEALEVDLMSKLEGDTETRVFRLDELEKFEMKGGFWGQTKLKRPGDKLKQITIRGKGNKARAIEFYQGRLS